MNLDQLNRANDLAGQLRGVKYKIESLLSSVTNNEVSLIEVLTGTSHDGEIVARIRDEETLKRISGEILQSFIESRARLEAELESLGVECRED